MDELTAQNPNSIRDMFSVISRSYDLANSVLSLGIHHRWKKKLISMARMKPGDSILDCATGTGDLPFLFEAQKVKKGQIIGCDFCEPMLEVARQKAKKLNSSIQFELADVMSLPYSDQQFNIVSISFGIRNVKDTQKGLSELGRVLKKGGRLLVLEFGQPRSTIMAWLFNFYSHWILPRLGGWVSGQPKAYRYLQTSSAKFPCGENFLNIARSTKLFSKTAYIPLQGGIAYLYILDALERK